MEIVILITAKDVMEAQKMSERLVAEKLAACVNIVAGVRSIFWWDRKVDQADEALMIVKSKKELFERIIKEVKSLHSYEVPEIIALPIIDGNKDYLKWINDSVLSKES